MPSKHKTPLLGWHPKSAELVAWVRAEAQRRGLPVARLLDEALETLRGALETLSVLRSMDYRQGGLPDTDCGTELLADLLDAAYAKGLEDAQ